MKKMIALIALCIVFSSTAFSGPYISSLEFVDENGNIKAEFTDQETVWMKIMLKNDDDVSYPKVRLTNYVAQRYGTWNYYWTYAPPGLNCETITIEEGMNPKSEIGPVYVPCTLKEKSAEGKYKLAILIQTYSTYWEKVTYSWYNLWFNYNPEQPWIGAVIRSRYLSEPNDNDQNKFPQNYEFDFNVDIENFNPEHDLTANLSFIESLSYAMCDNLVDINIPAGETKTFTANCETREASQTSHWRQGIYLILHLGSDINKDRIAYFPNTNLFYVYVDVGKCGNNEIEPYNNEQCDGTDMPVIGGNPTTCKNYGYIGGDLSCTDLNCRLDYSECIPRPNPQVTLYPVYSNMNIYFPGEEIKIYADVRNSASGLSDFYDGTFPSGSLLRLNITNRRDTSQTQSKEFSLEGLEAGKNYREWHSFQNWNTLLDDFSITAYALIPSEEYEYEGEVYSTFQRTATRSTVYRPVEPVDLDCTNVTEGGLVHFTCTSDKTSRVPLRLYKDGGNYFKHSLNTSKPYYFRETADAVIITDNPKDTTYYITLAFPVQAAPEMGLVLAAVVIVLLSAFVWEKYAE